MILLKVLLFYSLFKASPLSNLSCWVSGWTNGATRKLDFQRHVDLPLIDGPMCQDLLRKTVLGPKYILDTSSFICAGGETGKGLKLCLKLSVGSNRESSHLFKMLALVTEVRLWYAKLPLSST